MESALQMALVEFEELRQVHATLMTRVGEGWLTWLARPTSAPYRAHPNLWNRSVLASIIIAGPIRGVADLENVINRARGAFRRYALALQRMPAARGAVLGSVEESRRVQADKVETSTQWRQNKPLADTFDPLVSPQGTALQDRNFGESDDLLARDVNVDSFLRHFVEENQDHCYFDLPFNDLYGGQWSRPVLPDPYTCYLVDESTRFGDVNVDLGFN